MEKQNMYFSVNKTQEKLRYAYLQNGHLKTSYDLHFSSFASL